MSSLKASKVVHATFHATWSYFYQFSLLITIQKCTTFENVHEMSLNSEGTILLRWFFKGESLFNGLGCKLSVEAIWNQSSNVFNIKWIVFVTVYNRPRQILILWWCIPEVRMSILSKVLPQITKTYRTDAKIGAGKVAGIF